MKYIIVLAFAAVWACTPARKNPYTPEPTQGAGALIIERNISTDEVREWCTYEQVTFVALTQFWRARNPETGLNEAGNGPLKIIWGHPDCAGPEVAADTTGARW